MIDEIQRHFQGEVVHNSPNNNVLYNTPLPPTTALSEGVEDTYSLTGMPTSEGFFKKRHMPR